MRDVARDIFQKALAEAGISKAFTRRIECDHGVLRICDDLYDLHSYHRVFVVSIGKAGHTMVQALEARTGSHLEGIVVCPDVAQTQVRGFRYFLGGHPTPNTESVRAAEAILKSLSAQNASSLVIYLLSGGGSSMAEKPIDDEISLEDLVATYRALVHSGAPIAEINAIRKHLSAIKGGRMAQAAYPARQVSILVSDVPDATPDALASGPTMAQVIALMLYRPEVNTKLFALSPEQARIVESTHRLKMLFSLRNTMADSLSEFEAYADPDQDPSSLYNRIHAKYLGVDMHDGARQRRNTQRRVRQEENPQNSRKSAWQRRDDDERIKPRLKIDDDQKVHKHD